jgi:hypothetical protein
VAERHAGLDWVSEKRDVLIQDAGGDELLSAAFAHDERGLPALCSTLVRVKVVLVAIERRDGRLIKRLLDGGLGVMAIYPNQVAAARPRFGASAGKFDRVAAFVLCKLACSDHHRFRVLVGDSDDTNALRALSCAREDLVPARVALANQLRAEVERFWPAAAGVGAQIDSLIGLAFCARYPSSLNSCGLKDKRLAAFLARHAYCRRKTPAHRLVELRDAPANAPESGDEARRAIVLALVAALKPIVANISKLTREIAHRV